MPKEPVNKRFSEEQKAAMRADVLAYRVTVEQLAERYGISKQRVHELIGRLDRPRQSREALRQIILAMDLRDTGLRPANYRKLERMFMFTVSDVVDKSEAEITRNVPLYGSTYLAELKAFLAAHGLKLRDE